jgi:hypothetical protein
MRTHALALLAALLLLLTAGAGVAAADEPTQAVGQSAGNQQSATSSANATQINPTNRNIDVRIDSPGDGGNVTQTNAADALALAGNANQTDQSATQTQSGAGTQAVGQQAASAQDATADAEATQIKPSNENISVRIHSAGDDGTVEQTNAAAAGAAAGNANSTAQAAEQSQSGGGGEQVAGQSAGNKQSAEADADATQVKPSNRNVSVRIGSAGDNGDVTQTNAALAKALAGNANGTTQSAEQSQGGDAAKCGGCGHGGGGVQAVGQKAYNGQDAHADAEAKQIEPSNDNTSVRIHSAGDDGDVTQTNLAGALGVALNANATDQSASQEQGGGDAKGKCGCGGTGVQAIGQSAYSEQDADADAYAKQIKPSNTNTPVRIGSPGGGGSVTQTNAALSAALAGNLNHTTQSATQSQAGGGGVQAIGQKAASLQDADAESGALQVAPSNTNAPVAIGVGYDKPHGCGCDGKSKGGGDDGKSKGGGDVTQTNLAASLGVAFNANATDQYAAQSQGGGMAAKHGCGCEHGGGVQAVGQSAWNGQAANASSYATQLWAANENSPVRIGSAGGGGSVDQTNAALAFSLAKNLNFLRQEVDQTQ